MTKDETVAYVFAMSVCAMAEIESMKAANSQSIFRQEYPIYHQSDFNMVPEKYGIHHNAVLKLFEEAL